MDRFEELIALAERKGLTVTVRIRPIEGGFDVLCVSGRRDGARPAFSDDFAAGDDRLEAIDRVTGLAAYYWEATSGGMAR